MNQPRRRPLHRDHLDVESTTRRFLDIAPEVELGRSQLKDKMRDAGWTANTPAGDRRSAPRLTVRCRECNEALAGSAGRDVHREMTGHASYEYLPQPAGMDPSCIDYADPTGELGLSLDRLTEDLLEFDDAWHNVRKFLRVMTEIARKHIPPASPAVPACDVTNCDSPVEATPNGGYRGLERIAGHWCVRPGERALCAKHRTRERRAS